MVNILGWSILWK